MINKAGREGLRQELVDFRGNLVGYDPELKQVKPDALDEDGDIIFPAPTPPSGLSWVNSNDITANNGVYRIEPFNEMESDNIKAHIYLVGGCAHLTIVCKEQTTNSIVEIPSGFKDTFDSIVEVDPVTNAIVGTGDVVNGQTGVLCTGDGYPAYASLYYDKDNGYLTISATNPITSSTVATVDYLCVELCNYIE